MQSYLQYKAFPNIDELNEFLSYFKHDVLNKEDKTWTYNNGAQIWVLNQVQFIPQGQASDDDESVTMSMTCLPIVSYTVMRA